MSGYDERLLASAPVATRAEKQEGYNVDLLGDSLARAGARSASATPPPAPVTHSTDHSKAEAGGSSAPSGYHGALGARPWYKTRKWLVISAVGAIVVIAAVVGGAVGGTVGSHKNSKSSDAAINGGDANGPGGASEAPASNTATAGGGGQAEGPTSSVSSAVSTGTTLSILNPFPTAQSGGGTASQ